MGDLYLWDEGTAGPRRDRLCRVRGVTLQFGVEVCTLREWTNWRGSRERPESAPLIDSTCSRSDPSDMAEIRVFHEDKFLCRAVCAELAVRPFRSVKFFAPEIGGDGNYVVSCGIARPPSIRCLT